MKITENLKKRIILIIVAVAAYILVPIPFGLLFLSYFHPSQFPLIGYPLQAIQISILAVLLYVAFVMVKPSLIPQNLQNKKIIVSTICTIIILAVVLPSDLISNQPIGSCTITDNAPNAKSISNNGKSTEQECIEDCIFIGKTNTRYNQKSCEFNSISTSWSKTPEDFKGYKPNL